MQLLSQFVDKPRQPHLHAAYNVLRYLKTAPVQELFFYSLSSSQLKAFCDSGWAGSLDKRRSMTRYRIFLRVSLISWKSKNHQTISKSALKSEYRAMTTTCFEVIWLPSVRKDLLVLNQRALLVCDN